MLSTNTLSMLHLEFFALGSFAIESLDAWCAQEPELQHTAALPSRARPPDAQARRSNFGSAMSGRTKNSKT